MIVSAVMRVDVKSFYGPYTARFMDNEPIMLREEDAALSGKEKLDLFKNWGDASNDSMLLLESVSELCHGKMIF